MRLLLVIAVPFDLFVVYCDMFLYVIVPDAAYGFLAGITAALIVAAASPRVARYIPDIFKRKRESEADAVTE